MTSYVINCGEDIGSYIGCPQYKSYSYYDSVPPGSTDCYAIGDCISPCPEGQECCCGASISGFIYSDDFDSSLISSGASPKALIYSGSVIDNIGSVGGVDFPSVPVGGTCYVLGILDQNTIVDAEIDGTKLKIPFTAQNDESCGPYGLYSVSVAWFFSCG